MTAPEDSIANPAKKTRSAGRRIAASAIFGFLFFCVLWYTVFSAVTAALVGSGATIIIVAASTWSDAFEAVLDGVANTLLGILAAIGAVFAAILSLFDI